MNFTYKESEENWMTVEEIIQVVQSHLIFLEESYQVGTLEASRWGLPEMARFFWSIMSGYNPSTIVWIDIQKSYEYFLNAGTDDDSMNYYKGLLKDNYKYITVDGNNRTITLVDIVAGKVALKPGHYSVPEFGEKSTKFNIQVKKGSNKFNKLVKPLIACFYSRKIRVTTYTNLSVDDGGVVFRAINDGMKLSDHQTRQSHASFLADWVRDMRKKYILSFKKVFTDGVINKLNADEFVAKCLSYTVSKDSSKSTLDTLYKNPGAVSNKFLSKSDDWFKSNIQSFFKEMGTYKWTSKTALFDAWVLVSEWKQEKDTKVQDMKAYLAIYYRELISLSNSKDTYESPCSKLQEQVMDYAGLLTKNLNPKVSEFRRNIILGRIESKLVDDGIIVQQESPNNRFFTAKQKMELWEEQDGVCPGTGESIPMAEIFDHTKWQADHKDPFDNGGKTTIPNGQLVSAKWNNQKSNKVA